MIYFPKSEFFSYDFITALITADLKPPSSNAFIPAIVDPPGEHISSLSTAGCVSDLRISSLILFVSSPL